MNEPGDSLSTIPIADYQYNFINSDCVLPDSQRKQMSQINTLAQFSLMFAK